MGPNHRLLLKYATTTELIERLRTPMASLVLDSTNWLLENVVSPGRESLTRQCLSGQVAEVDGALIVCVALQPLASPMYVQLLSRSTVSG
jgi:hypothetical protein